MTSSTVALTVPQARTAPRGAIFLANTAAALLQWAERALPSAQSRAIREAAQARALAREFERFDRRMAADLYVAADRHEQAAQ